MMGNRGSERQQKHQLQLQAPPRRGRWFDEEPPPTTTATCRSCAALAIADCVALVCCPCAVVSLLGLALVKAPLAVGRSCVARLRARRRFRLLLRRKRVRDADADADAAPCARGKAEALAPVQGQDQGQQAEAELAWLDEMYPVAHWGFGRVSFSDPSGSGRSRPTP